MQGSAEKARGDLEQQYRLLMKAGELGNIITKSSKFARWKQNVRVKMEKWRKKRVFRLENRKKNAKFHPKFDFFSTKNSQKIRLIAFFR